MIHEMDLSADVESGGLAAVCALAGIPRLRSDLWNRLRDAARRLDRDEEEEEDGSLQDTCEFVLARLATIERYYAFPGLATVGWLGKLLVDDRAAFAASLVRISRIQNTGAHRRIDLLAERVSSFLDVLRRDDRSFERERTNDSGRPYFEVLVVEDAPSEEFAQLRSRLRSFRTADDRFLYEPVRVKTVEDALLAVAVNPDIAAVVVRFGLPLAGPGIPEAWRTSLYGLVNAERSDLESLRPGQRTTALGDLLAGLRPELDLYRVTDAPVESVIGPGSRAFRRLFYLIEDYQDLHVSILRGVAERYETPFFDALRSYARRPTGMFHALPLSRGRTISKSHWIRDFGDFYGKRLFLAETSTTAGGLDSLLQPTGSLRDAQLAAARAFGSGRTYFVTNGTSTANKIVLQALARPNDLVLMGHDCHKSHPYAAILCGANPIFLDGYPLHSLSMYGGVPLRRIIDRLLLLRERGLLSRVRVLLLTNLTFDGITYDPYRIMRAVLTIHPDISFIWDEAWFAYARCSPLLRPRTAMAAAARLTQDLREPDYADKAAAWRAEHRCPDAEVLTGGEVFPDPDTARVRVYATQSTHKTLTALRQGSMIHVMDPDFERLVEDPFREAYMTHTSTSPNYQILASLDVGRRQIELEGYGLVGESIDLAMLLRERIRTDPMLSTYFTVLGPADMVPGEHRASGIAGYLEPGAVALPIEDAWRGDEFVLDPTRVTVHVGRTGYDGDEFKALLMDEHAIHINKTSRNSVLFLIHIGAARGTVAHLVKVLTDIAVARDQWLESAAPDERERFDQRVLSLTEDLPALPDFSGFHPTFVPEGLIGTGAGDIRRAFFLAYDSQATSYVALDEDLANRVEAGQVIVAAAFVTPYPPGFPVLVPGQILSAEILGYLLALDTTEVHGLHPELGMRIFEDHALHPHPLPSPPLVPSPPISDLSSVESR